MSRGRRHTLALGAAQNVHSGMTPDAALAAALDGKSLSAPDRTLVEAEMVEILERDPPKREAAAPAAELEPEAEAETADPVIAPPGAAERDAEVERIASGTVARAKHERRSTAERLNAALCDLEDAKAEVLRLRYLDLADQLAAHADARAAATVVRASVHAGFWPEAESAARRGCTAIGVPVPAWVGAKDGPTVLRLDVERVMTPDDGDDCCEVLVDGRKVAVIGLAGVVGELQIVRFGADGVAEPRAVREMTVTIGGES